MTKLMIRPNRVSREIDQFFNDFFNSPKVWEDANFDFVPRVNITENENEVALKFELPGMEKDDIKVTLKNNVLTVSGERKVEKEQTDKNIVRTEMTYGSFCRSFTLPETVNTDKINANYKNGILELGLAKKEETKPNEIEVKIS